MRSFNSCERISSQHWHNGRRTFSLRIHHGLKMFNSNIFKQRFIFLHILSHDKMMNLSIQFLEFVIPGYPNEKENSSLEGEVIGATLGPLRRGNRLLFNRFEHDLDGGMGFANVTWCCGQKLAFFSCVQKRILTCYPNDQSMVTGIHLENVKRDIGNNLKEFGVKGLKL
ncbi:hypothetical protein MA16_Dca007331 [Dendrobium catenatum]|uniref:Uncharacterized protein n=1 Tax=Dendrobium catenatum TaxID=906689 RepID=A0A2I0W8I1_9ASPA|nr:hypothetical protein MA16_Dca007331 [Dendrobium catenatum]